MAKGKEDYYKGENWAEKGDAFVAGKAPHLDKNYKCPCGGAVAIEGILRDLGELVETLTKCKNCGQLHCVLVDKRHS